MEKQEIMKNLIDKLNDLQITQKSSDWAEDVPQDIWELKSFSN